MITINRNNPTPGEITSSLTNSTDAAGLHFDGAAGNIDIPGSGSAPVVALGTKFSFEFIVQADEWKTTGVQHFLCDFGNGGRLIFGTLSTPAITGELGVYSVGGWNAFTGNPKVLDDLKVHHLVVTIDGTAAVLYDNGNQIGTATITSPNIDSCSDAAIGSAYNSATTHNFNGTIYRARLWNKTLTAAEVTATFENSTVPFADQYGVQTNKITGAVDKNWGTPRPNTVVDATDRDDFNAAYVWNTYLYPTDISVASNVLTFTAAAGSGFYFPTTQTSGKRYRITLATGTISGEFKVQTYNGSAFVDAGTLTASSTNAIEWVAPSGASSVFIVATSAGTIQLDASSVSTEIVAAGCVADYELSANPTQSLLVQDRAGAADGTSSATGVTQVTPIEQLNSKSVSVSNATQRTPANGDIVADQVGAGIVPAVPLHAKVSATTGSSPLEVARLEVKDDGVDCVAGMGPKLAFYIPHNTASFEGASIAAKKESVSDSNEATSLVFSTIPNAFGAPVERVTIDSAGLATFSAGIVSSAMPTSDPSVAGQLWNDSGTVKISAG